MAKTAPAKTLPLPCVFPLQAEGAVELAVDLWPGLGLEPEHRKVCDRVGIPSTAPS